MYFYFFIFFFKWCAHSSCRPLSIYTHYERKKRILFLVLYIWLCWLWVCNILLLLVVIKTVRGIGRRARLRDRLSSSQHDCHPWVVFIPSPLFFFFFLYTLLPLLYMISFNPNVTQQQCFPPSLSRFFFFSFFLSSHFGSIPTTVSMKIFANFFFFLVSHTAASNGLLSLSL